MRAVLRYAGAIIAGMAAALITSWLVYAVVPKPDGPPDQLAGHNMAFTFCIFPVLTIFFCWFAVLYARPSRDD